MGILDCHVSLLEGVDREKPFVTEARSMHSSRSQRSRVTVEDAER